MDESSGNTRHTDDAGLSQITHTMLESAIHSILDSAGKQVAILSADGTILYMNATMAENFGYTSETLSGTNIWEIASKHPSYELNREMFDRCLDGTTPVFYEVYCPAIYRHFQIALSKISQSTILLIGMDVTINKLLEKALLESENRYKTLVDETPDFIFIVDRDFRVSFINKACADIFNTTQDQLTGKNIADIFPPHNSSHQISNMIQVFETGKPRTAENPITFPGGEIWLDAKLTPLRNQQGDITHVLGISRDITKRIHAENELRKHKERLEEHIRERTEELTRANEALQLEIAERLKTEIALRESRNMFQLVMDNIPQAIFWKGHDSRYLGANVAFENFCGKSKSEIIGNADIEMPWSRDSSFYINQDNEVMRTGSPMINLLESITFRDNSEHWLKKSKLPLHDIDGNIIGVLGLFEDITDKRNAELMLQSSKRESEFYLDLITHDLTNFHHTILGNLELLTRRTALADNQRKYVETARRQLLKCETTISKVRAFSKVKKTGIEYLRPIDISEPIRETCRMVASLYPAKKLVFTINPETGIKILASDLIDSVFLNIIENAAKHSPREVTDISISAVLTSDPANATPMWQIRIEDNGGGIPDIFKDKIFTRFMRASEEKGSGLGMALAKSIIDKIGGRIWAEDRVQGSPSLGAAFVMLLPAAPDAG